MRILLAILLIASGQAIRAQDQTLLGVMGCYELRVERSRQVSENYGHQFLPKKLELTAEPGAFGWLAVKNVDSNRRWDLSLSSWSVNDDGTVELGLSTGFVGWHIHLKRAGSDLHGTARFWTDTDAKLGPDSGLGPFRTVARKVSCEEARTLKSEIRAESYGSISGTLEHHSPETDWALLKVIVLAYPNPDVNHPVRETTLEPEASKFEIGQLPPGRYILGAYVVRKLGTPDRYSFANWGWSYFPGVYDPKLALPIQVLEAKSVPNVKLKMMY